MNVNPIKRLYETKPVQKFFQKAGDPKHADFFNNSLPTWETAASTAMYCINTELQVKKGNIPREQGNVLQWQNVLSCAAGMVVGSWLNRKVSKFANKLIPKLKPELIEDAHKVTGGLKVILPLTATAMLMRCVIPTVIAQASTIIEDHRREQKKKGLNVKA